MKILNDYSLMPEQVVIKFSLTEDDCSKLNYNLVKEFKPKEPYFIEGSLNIDGDFLSDDTQSAIENAQDLNDIMQEDLEENIDYLGMGQIALGTVENSEGMYDTLISILFNPLDIWDRDENSMDNVDTDIFMPMLYDALYSYLVD